MTHTNTAELWFAAADILKAVGRLQEHEMWGGDPSHKKYITTELTEAAEKIANWLGFALVTKSDSEFFGIGMSDHYAPLVKHTIRSVSEDDRDISGGR